MNRRIVCAGPGSGPLRNAVRDMARHSSLSDLWEVYCAAGAGMRLKITLF